MSRLRQKKPRPLSGSTNEAAAGRLKRSKLMDLDRDGDENIESDSDESSQRRRDSGEEDDEIEEEETLDAKKVRLARAYLRNLEDGDDSATGSSSDDDASSDGSEDGEDDAHERISARLQRDRLKREGMLERDVADKVRDRLLEIYASVKPTPAGQVSTKVSQAEIEAQNWVSSGRVSLLTGHDLTPTSVALLPDGHHALSGSKDHSVLLWDVEKQQRLSFICKTWKKSGANPDTRNDGEVLSVACSDDGHYAAVGKRDATVSIYDVRARESANLVKTFTGHKAPVTGLAFRTQTLQLFSASEDRCIRHYNLTEMLYLETLYGHQFGVSGIDCHRKERPISVGRDRTARAWKLDEDSHLIFRGGAKVSSADCVSVIKDDWFLTGHDDGNLSLWMTDKKKAVKTIPTAHGLQDSGIGRGISCVTSLKGGDIAFSGSCDGYLRLWNVQTGQTLSERGMEPINKIPIHGYINDIAVGPKARFCVMACGQEPRLGRWARVPRSKNRFAIVPLSVPGSNVDDESENENDGEVNESDSQSESGDESENENGDSQ